MTQLTGSVSAVVYHNTDTGYTVLRLKSPNSSVTQTAVGLLPALTEGEWLELEGNWMTHARFGAQFQVKSYKIHAPQGPEEIERYLSGGLFSGIGPVTAHRIVEFFGENTFAVLDHHAERIYNVPKLHKRIVSTLIREWQEQKESRELMVFLQNHNLPASLGTRLMARFGSRSLEVIRKDPYQLIGEINGIGFQRADEMALSMGYDFEDPGRLRAGIRYALQKYCETGHVYAQRETLIKNSSELLRASPELITYTLDRDLDEKWIIEEERARYYLPSLYISEKNIATRLVDMTRHGVPASAFLPTGFAPSDRSPEGIVYTDMQKQAMNAALNNALLVLTGGPGTGKTTTLWGILRIFLQANMLVSLAAPTGRAAKRLSEVTGFPAQTLHRLLKWEPSTHTYQANEKNPLELQALIVDEFSMVDTYLFNSLLRALPSQCRLIIVGDKDQLPSIGPGNVLSELVQCPQIPRIHLDQITRQAAGSAIIQGAHRILKGEVPEIPTEASDFEWIQATSAHECLTALENSLKQYDAQKRSIRRYQVLTPVNQGPLGIHELNVHLQKWINPLGTSHTIGDTHWRLGDKVMQIKNNYDKNVFNGDLGELYSVDMSQQKLWVQFDELVEYRFEELKELQLAYAATIHKSQGSEFDLVFLLIHPIHLRMLQKNLLYTAFTRAKQKLVLIGPVNAAKQGVQNQKVEERLTLLRKKINYFWEPLDLPF